MKGAVKVENRVNFIGGVRSFTVMGDPGCDGLGVEIMTTFAKALGAAPSDLSVILGDLVPFGLEEFYKYIRGLIDDLSPGPVYTLCGNHDTAYYARYFGLSNYALVGDDLLLVALDNSKRVFEDATLDFLRDTLQKHRRRNILVMFHIPPPNGYSQNCMKREEWLKLKAVLDPFRNDVKYLLSGHVHSYFTEEVDGYRAIVSAGAGARLEFFGRLPGKDTSFHHVLRFYLDGSGELRYEYVSLADKVYEREAGDARTREYLAAAFRAEAEAQLRYRLFAEDARQKGCPGVSKLLGALAESAFYHARNYFSVLNGLRGIGGNLEECRRLEAADAELLSGSYLPYAVEGRRALTGYAFAEAYGAKRNYSGLLPEAARAYAAGGDLPSARYYVCTSCGNTGRLEGKVEHCPICGAPLDKIAIV
jgi:rubrerythrin